jgi:hypothetical protein
MFTITTLLRKVIKINSDKGFSAKKRSKLRQIFGFSSLTINLGITWCLFLLYVHKWSSYFSIFSYVFIVLNGSQVRSFLNQVKQYIILKHFILFKGFFIFIYQLAIYLNRKSKQLNENKLSHESGTSHAINSLKATNHFNRL